jgi:hypothetical protein
MGQSARKFAAGEFFGHILPAEEQSDEQMLRMMQEFTRQYNREREKQKQND